MLTVSLGIATPISLSLLPRRRAEQDSRAARFFFYDFYRGADVSCKRAAPLDGFRVARVYTVRLPFHQFRCDEHKRHAGFIDLRQGCSKSSPNFFAIHKPAIVVIAS